MRHSVEELGKPQAQAGEASIQNGFHESRILKSAWLAP